MGTASGVGVTGSGLDLVLVLDSSGSMGRFEAGQTLQQWQRDAAIALVNSLPTGTTSVSIVEFDSFASVVTGLTPLLPVGNIAAIEAAINGVNASGGTTIGSGITAAQTVLTGATATAGRSGQMVVLSDGFSSSPATQAAAAKAAGLIVHSVALPGANIPPMQSVASNGGGVFTDFSNPADLANLVAVFSGTGGNLVGFDRVEV